MVTVLTPLTPLYVRTYVLYTYLLQCGDVTFMIMPITLTVVATQALVVGVVGVGVVVVVVPITLTVVATQALLTTTSSR